MDKKDQRINVTLFSTLEYEMVKALASLQGTSFSSVVAKGFSEWLKENFITELEFHSDAENYLKKVNGSAPTDNLFYKDENNFFVPWRGE
tara:strand:- start:338 stop:607 length:270 start_codon:yes stop_codon:yes gene_type:complete